MTSRRLRRRHALPGPYATAAGPVTILRPGQRPEVRPAYTRSQLAKIVRRGRHGPPAHAGEAGGR